MLEDVPHIQIGFVSRKTPTLKYLPRLYRLILTLTRKRGLRTLSKMHEAIFSRGHIQEMPCGADFYVPSDRHFFGYTSLVHERHIEDVIMSTVEPGDICIDVGANLGYFSVMMAARAGANGIVYAFEPARENFELLSINAWLAAIQAMRILPFCKAVSSKNGDVSLQKMPLGTLHRISEARDEQEIPNLERVVAVTLSSFLGDCSSRIALIKIDVEGHEQAVVEGLLHLLDHRRVHRMIIEVTPGTAWNIQEMLRPYSCDLCAWIDNGWRKIDFCQLHFTTDMLVDFSRNFQK